MNGSRLDLESIAAAIAAAGARWKPRRNRGHRRGFVAARPAPHRGFARIDTLAAPAAAPPPIDWRDKASLTPPEEQGDHMTCTSFALCGTMQDQHVIDRPGDKPLRLSAGYLHLCVGKLNLDEPYDLQPAVEAVESHPIPDAREDDYSWDRTQDDSSLGGYEIAGFTELDTVDAAKAALQKGPFVTTLELWEDLADWYGTGVFSHVKGVSKGQHTVEVVGWHQAPDCWVVKNSFGTGWGDKGFALIAFGECQMLVEFCGYALEGVVPVALA